MFAPCGKSGVAEHEQKACVHTKIWAASNKLAKKNNNNNRHALQQSKH